MNTDGIGDPGPEIVDRLKSVEDAGGGSVLFIDVHCGIHSKIQQRMSVLLYF